MFILSKTYRHWNISVAIGSVDGDYEWRSMKRAIP